MLRALLVSLLLLVSNSSFAESLEVPADSKFDFAGLAVHFTLNNEAANQDFCIYMQNNDCVIMWRAKTNAIEFPAGVSFSINKAEGVK